MVLKGDRQQWLVLVLVLLAALLGYACYAQAHDLTWQFDDLINLRGLEQVSSWSGLQAFVFGGIAGPGGRPLALLSFVADYPHWPNNPWGMVQGALLWHLMNALLVFLLARVLLARQPAFAKRAVVLAGIMAVVWALLPIHASSLLMPVQRMVHVSSFFVLLTLLGHCHLRIALAGGGGVLGVLPLLAWAVLGSLAAVLAKESGAVVPALIAVIELLLLRQLPPPCDRRLWRLGVLAALLAVPVALAAFLWLDWPAMQAIYRYQRDFSPSERLATQVVVLWEYLQQTLLPRASALGPFHDGHRVYDWLALPVLLGLLAWALLWLLAWRGTRRGSLPAGLLLFALAWYFSAQQIESSLIPLELYFEHRNYLAALGVVAAVVLLAAHLLRQQARLRLALGALLVLLGALQLFSLQQITSLWGQPLLAAEMWYMKHPDSMRAAQTLSWQYGLIAFDAPALRVLDEYAAVEDARVGARIQALGQACALEQDVALQGRLQQIRARVPALRRPAEILAGLSGLGGSIRDGRCSGLSIADYQALLQDLLENPQISNAPRVRHHVYYELALSAQAEGRAEDYLRYARLAFLDFPSISVAQMIALRHFEQLDVDGALAWIDEAVDHAPSEAAAQAWAQELDGLRQAILQVRQQLESMEQHDAEQRPDDVD